MNSRLRLLRPAWSAGTVGNVFIVGAIDVARRGGRLADGVEAGDGGAGARRSTRERWKSSDSADDVESAVDAMAVYVDRLAPDGPMRVGVGHVGAAPIADALADRLRGRSDVTDLVRYEISPSVGAHTGFGTVGAVFFPDQLVH